MPIYGHVLTVYHSLLDYICVLHVCTVQCVLTWTQLIRLYLVYSSVSDTRVQMPVVYYAYKAGVHQCISTYLPVKYLWSSYSLVYRGKE